MSRLTQTMKLPGELLGILLMSAEQGESRLEQRFELSIVSVRNPGAAERFVDRAVISHLVLHIGPIEGGPLERREPAVSAGCLARKRSACRVRFGCYPPIIPKGS
jgi:hypothetical protein